MTKYPLRNWLRWHRVLNGLFEITHRGVRGFLGFLGFNGKRHASQDRRPQRRTYQPSFDILEERQLLATRVWDGGGADNLFSTAENWSSDTAPVTGDIILFDATSSKDAIVDTGWTATDLEDVDIQSGYSGTITSNRDLTITDDFVQSGGVVAGSYGNDIIVSAGGSFTWEAGTQTGGGTTLIESGASLSITGSATRYLEGGRKLRNEGSGTWTGAGTIESTDDPGTMENVGDLELGGTGTLYVSAANASGNDAALTLANTGILTKTGAGTFTFDGAALENDDTVEVDAGKLVLDGGSSTGATITVASGAELETTASYNIGALDNEGTVTVSAGTLTLSGEGEASGAFEVSSGAVLSFGADYTLASGSDVGGAGHVTVTTGEIEVSGTYDVALTVLSGGAFLLEENNTVAALHLVGGWVKGSGTLTVTEEMEWSTGGGFDGAGRTVVADTATLSIDTGAGNTLYLQGGYTLENEGEGVLAGNGYLTQNRYDITETTGVDEGSATLLNEGSLEITGAVSLNVSYGSPALLLLDNQGTLTKSGEGTVTFNNRVRLENDGTITVSAGTLRISGEGEASGSFAVDAEALLAFASNYTLLTGTEVTGAMTVESSDLTIEGTVTAEGLNLQGGWIKGTGTLNVTEVLLWTNGGFDSAGRTVVGETAELTIDTGTSGGGGTRTLYLQGGYSLENEGDGVLAGDGYLTQNRYDITETTGVDEGSATLLNEGSLEITGAVTFNVSYGSPASLVLDNQGTLTKSSESTATLAGRARLDNVGTVHVTAGGLAINGGGTAEGDFVVSSGAALSFGDDYTLDTGSDVGGAGQVNVTAGAVEVSGTYDVALTVVTGGSVLFEANNSVAGLHVEGGWVKGTGTLTVTEELEWTGGGFDSAGRTVVGEEATLSIDTGTSGGGGIRTLYLQGGYSLENDGDGVLAGDGYLTQNRYDITETTGVDEGSATLLNEGTLEITGAVTLNVSYGSPASLLLDNQGLLVKSGESTATLSGRARLENNGTIQVTAGVLAVNGGGEASGDFVVSSGGVLSFGENFALASGSDVGGAGQVNVTSGAVEVSGIYDVDLTVVTAGSIAFEANNTVAGLHVEGGWVKGTSTLTVTDELEWTGGGFDGAGRTVVADTATLSIDTGAGNTLYLQGGYTLQNEGEGVLAGNGYLTQNRYDITETTGVDEGSAILLNEGTLEITGAVTFNVSYGSPASLLLDNQGTLTKTGEGTVTFNNRARLENDGIITVSAGTLRISGEGEASGSFAVDAEAVLAFASNYTLSTGTEVTGAMTVESNNLTIEGSVTAEGLILAGGWVKGSGTLTVTEDLEWSLGGGFDSAGHTIVAEGATLTIDTGSGSYLYLNGDYTLENQGDGVILGTGYLRQDGYEKSSTLLNEGTLDVQSSVNFYVYYSGSGSVLLVDNQGTLTKSAEGTSTFYAAARLNNEGTVNVTGGSLVLSGKGEAVGDFVVSSGTALSFGDDYTLATGSDVGGTGQVNVTGGVVAVSGTYDVALTEVVGGSIQFEANNTIAALHLEGGWVKGSATLTVTDELEWSSGGGFDGAGRTVISESATLSIDTGSGSNLFLNGDYTLENQGDGVILGTGYLRQDGYEKSSTLLNEGTLDIQSAVNFYVYYSSVSALLLDNQGTLTKSGEGTATFLSEARLENDGTVNVTGGTLRISGEGEASGSFAVDAEAVLAIASDFTLLTGTSVTGAITVESNNLTIEGTVTAEGLHLTGGWVKGSGSLTVTDELEWSNGGGFDSAGHTIVAEGATLSIDTGSYSNLFLNGDYTLENQGDGVILGTGYLRQDGYEKSSTLLNEGTLDIQSAVNFYVYYTSVSALLVDNQGTLIKSGEGAATFYSAVRLDNYGTIDVQAGNFNLSGGYNLGLTSVAPDSEITYNTETYTQDVAESGPFAAQGGYTYEGNQRDDPTTQTLATFTDPDGSGALSEFTATVIWGDGSSPEEVDVSFSGGTFIVTGGHSYQAGGDLVFSVVISRDGVGDLLVHGHALINRAPDVVDDVYAVARDTLLVGSSVLANDSDYHGGAEGEGNTPLTAELVDGPDYADSFTLNADGTFSYTPDEDYYGLDTFTYRVTDAVGSISEEATVTITVVGAEAVVRVLDPNGALLVPLGAAAVDLSGGGLRVSHALDFDLSPGTDVGLSPALVYNSSTVDVRPIVKVLLTTDASQPLPEEIQLRLTFDGVTQGWVTFSTEGHAAGDSYVLAVQVEDAVTETGLYDWTVEVKTKYTSTYQPTVTFGGSTSVVVRDDSAFGAGWGLAGLERLVAVDGGVLWVNGNGDARLFLDGVGDTFVNPTGEFGSLVRNGDDTYTYTATSQVAWHFDEDGLLTSIEETHGLTWEYEYDGGRLVSFTAIDGSETTFAYTGGFLTSITEPGSRVVEITQTASGDVSHLTQIEDADGSLRLFDYDSDHRLIEDTWNPLNASFDYDDETGLLVEVDRGLGVTYEIVSAAGQGLQTDEALDASFEDDASITDALNHTTAFALDAQGRLLARLSPEGSEESWEYNGDGLLVEYVDPNNESTLYGYNAYGDLTSIDYADGGWVDYGYHTTFHTLTSETIGVDGGSVVNTGTYDAETGDVLTWTTADGSDDESTVEYFWNEDGLLEYTIDGVDNYTFYFYDAYLRLTGIDVYTGEDIELVYFEDTSYDANGNYETWTTFAGVTDYIYSATNRLLFESIYNPDTTTLVGYSAYAYSDAGLLESVFDSEGNERATIYDVVGRVTDEFVYDDEETVFWTRSYEYDVVNNVLKVTEGDESWTAYTHDDDGRVESEETHNPGEFGAVVSSRAYAYDDAGNVEKITDPDGSYSTFLYDELNRVKEEYRYNAEDELVDFTFTDYNLAGRVERVQDYFGNTTEYRYDDAGRLEHVWTRDYYNTIVEEAYYVYDDAGNLEAIIDGIGNETESVHDGAGRVTHEFIKDETDAIIWEVFNVHDDAGRVTQQTDGEGNVTFWVYDGAGRVRHKEIQDEEENVVWSADYHYNDRGLLTREIDGEGRETRYTYTAAGQMKTQTVAYGTSDAATTTWHYNARGQVTSIVDPLGNVTLYQYDGAGRMTYQAIQDDEENVVWQATYIHNTSGYTTGQVDGEGNVTFSQHDGAGRVTYQYIEDENENVLWKVNYIYDDAGRMTSLFDGEGRETRYGYDAAGRKTSETLAYGTAQAATTSWLFDDAGQLLRVTDPRGHYTAYEYDEAGQLVHEERRDSGNYLLSEMDYVYDLAGRMVSQTDGEGNTTDYVYDAAGNVIHQETRDATEAILSEMDFVYDQSGKLTAQIDGEGRETRFLYDGAGRKQFEIQGYGTSLAATTQWVYDDVGRVIEIIDPVSNHTIFTFDAAGHRLSMTDPLTNTVTYAYDLAGRMTSTTDRNGLRRDFAYDEAGRQETEKWYALDGTTLVETLSWTYDLSSRMLTAESSVGEYVFTYDAAGRVETVEEPFDVSLSFEYDLSGNRTVVTDSFGGSVTSTYDGANRLISRLFQQTDRPTLRIDIEYDNAGRISKQTRYSDASGTTVIAVSEYIYDEAGRLVSLEHKDDMDSVIGDAAYSYVFDVSGQLLEKTDHGDTIVFEYDELKQVTDDGVSEYEYDENGNRVMSGYVTGDNNRLLSDGTWNYGYDDEGNRVSRTNIATGEVWAYFYDHRGQLVKVERRASATDPVDLRVEFGYDALGNRIVMSEDADGDGSGDAALTKYSFDDWKTGPQREFVGNENHDVWAVLNDEDELTTRYLRGDVVDELFARVVLEGSSWEAYWSLNDYQNSVRDILNSVGSLVNTVTFDAFGNVVSESAPQYRDGHGWQGLEYYGSIGMYGTPSRWYDPVTGQWIVLDPKEFGAGDSNLYRGMGNNTPNATDPSGFDSNPSVAQDKKWRDIKAGFKALGFDADRLLFDGDIRRGAEEAVKRLKLKHIFAEEDDNRVSNAIRHLYVFSRVRIEYGREAAEKLAAGHEEMEDNIDSVMDKHNNEIAFAIGDKILSTIFGPKTDTLRSGIQQKHPLPLFDGKDIVEKDGMDRKRAKEKFEATQVLPNYAGRIFAADGLLDQAILTALKEKDQLMQSWSDPRIKNLVGTKPFGADRSQVPQRMQNAWDRLDGAIIKEREAQKPLWWDIWKGLP